MKKHRTKGGRAAIVDKGDNLVSIRTQTLSRVTILVDQCRCATTTLVADLLPPLVQNTVVALVQQYGARLRAPIFTTPELNSSVLDPKITSLKAELLDRILVRPRNEIS
jgi:hypothetical protein